MLRKVLTETLKSQKQKLTRGGGFPRPHPPLQVDYNHTRPYGENEQFLIFNDGAMPEYIIHRAERNREIESGYGLLSRLAKIAGFLALGATSYFIVFSVIAPEIEPSLSIDADHPPVHEALVTWARDTKAFSAPSFTGAKLTAENGGFTHNSNTNREEEFYQRKLKDNINAIRGEAQTYFENLEKEKLAQAREILQSM